MRPSLIFLRLTSCFFVFCVVFCAVCRADADTEIKIALALANAAKPKPPVQAVEVPWDVSAALQETYVPVRGLVWNGVDPPGWHRHSDGIDVLAHRTHYNRFGRMVGTDEAHTFPSGVMVRALYTGSRAPTIYPADYPLIVEGGQQTVIQQPLPQQPVIRYYSAPQWCPTGRCPGR